MIHRSPIYGITADPEELFYEWKASLSEDADRLRADDPGKYRQEYDEWYRDMEFTS